jgi:hypothetical protein
MVVNARPAAGGGRWVDISPERLRGWLDGFYSRHDGATEDGLTLTGSSNGDTATLHPPPGVTDATDLDSLLEGVARPRPIALLLARKGAVAVGVHNGLKLVASKVDRFYVQGRTAAGGWSQQRYARRRGNQTDAAVDGAVEVAARVLLPVGEVTAVVCGGDRAMVDAVLADPRLAPLVPLRHPFFLDVVEPRLAVLEEAVVTARRVRIHLVP